MHANMPEPYSPTPEEKLAHWGEGPWVNEPNEFEFEYKGYRCFGRRVAVWDGWKKDKLSLGHWCGYIVIPLGHPWHGKEAFNEERTYVGSEVHGGITHAGFAHIVPGFSIGFDCGHSFDIMPSIEKMMKEIAEKDSAMKKIRRDIDELNKSLGVVSIFSRTYRDIEYVKQECKRLAEQAIIEAKG